MLSKYQNHQYRDYSRFIIPWKVNMKQDMRYMHNQIIQTDNKFLDYLSYPRVDVRVNVDDIYCFWPPIQKNSQYESNENKWWICPQSTINSSLESTKFSPFQISQEPSFSHEASNQLCYFSEERNKLNKDIEHEEEKSFNSQNIIRISIAKESDVEDESFVPNRVDTKNKGSKRKLLQLKFRSDVILKTIFRSFRKYCIKDFKTHYDFVKLKENSNRLMRKVKEYLIQRYGFENSPMWAIFIWIIDTRHKYFQIDDEQEEIGAKISELMYRFTNDRMFELINWAEFSLQFQEFLSQPDILNRVLKNRNDLPLKREYRAHITNLLSLISKI